MNKKGKIISSVLSLLFIGGGLYVYYLINSIPEYFYTQLSDKGIVFMLYTLLIIGCTAITYNFIHVQSNLEFIFVEKSAQAKEDLLTQSETNEQTANNDALALIYKEIKNIINTDNPVNKKTDKILSLLCNNLEACQGIIYRLASVNAQQALYPFSTYAFIPPENKTIEYQLGEGLVGVSAKEDRKLIINDIPEGYIKVVSGLGKSYPNLIAIYPLKHKNTVTGILELALFSNIDTTNNKLLEEILSDLGLLVA